MCVLNHEHLNVVKDNHQDYDNYIAHSLQLIERWLSINTLLNTWYQFQSSVDDLFPVHQIQWRYKIHRLISNSTSKRGESMKWRSGALPSLGAVCWTALFSEGDWAAAATTLGWAADVHMDGDDDPPPPPPTTTAAADGPNIAPKAVDFCIKRRNTETL